MTDLGPRLGRHPHDTLRHVLSLNPRGCAMEFGVAKGTTLRMIAEHMPAFGFDSFQGLPEFWRHGFEKGRFACDPPDIHYAQLVFGLFSETLPTFPFPSNIGLVHIDCDLYSSTAEVLRWAGPHLQPGCFIVFDEFHGYPGCEAHEQRAWAEWVADNPVTWTVIGHGPEQWAIQLTSPEVNDD